MQLCSQPTADYLSPPDEAHSHESLRVRVARLPHEAREKFFARYDEPSRALLRYQWRGWNARPEQLQPEDTDWMVWFVLAGRGFGKTRTGVEWVLEEMRACTWQEGIFIAPTASDLRNEMIYGPSGLLRCVPPWERDNYRYWPSKKRLDGPGGQIVHLWSAEDSELRGKHLRRAWWDEPAKCKTLEGLWSNLELCMRALGDEGDDTPPRTLLTGTPLPLEIFKQILAQPETRAVRGTSMANRANLDPRWFKRTIIPMLGTRLGRQEVLAEILEAEKGALWTQGIINATRWLGRALPKLRRTIVAVDPSGSANRMSDDVGIIVLGEGEDGHVYVLEDLSGLLTPAQWGDAVVGAYDRWNAEAVVAETNYGAGLVARNIVASERSEERNGKRKVRVIGVRSEGDKATRAAPVSTLYERGLVHHCRIFQRLEEEMTGWVPYVSSKSPNRIDALAIGCTHLGLVEAKPTAQETFSGMAEANKMPPREDLAELHASDAFFDGERGRPDIMT